MPRRFWEEIDEILPYRACVDLLAGMFMGLLPFPAFPGAIDAPGLTYCCSAFHENLNSSPAPALGRRGAAHRNFHADTSAFTHFDPSHGHTQRALARIKIGHRPRQCRSSDAVGDLEHERNASA